MKFADFPLINKALYLILYLTGHGMGVFVVAWGVLELLYGSKDWWKLVLIGVIWHGFVKLILRIYVKDIERFMSQ